VKRLFSAAAVLILLGALAVGVRRAVAQVSEVQPFTAVETTVTPTDKSKVPNVSVGVLAVSGDGQRVATLSRVQLVTGRSAYSRTVFDKTAQTRVTINPDYKMRIHHPYHDVQGNYISGGAVCYGAPDGQIEGFDVNVKDFPFAPSDNGDTRVRRRWFAPKLGCFVLRDEEKATDKTGKVIFTAITTVSNIVIGEPDPSYFDTSLPEGYVDAKPEDWKGAVVNRLKQQQKQ
jgi:hypothetical protein